MRSVQRGLHSILVVSTMLGLAACTSKEDPATCTRSTASAGGPGDVSGYFPLEVGSKWYYEVQDSNEGFKSGEPYQVSVEVTGTQAASGATASVFTTTLLGSSEAPGVSLFSKGPSGVTEHAGGELDQALAQLYPYQILVFPLTTGATHELVACQDLDYGQDLDGDGKNERFDVRSSSATVGDEVVALPVGTFTARRVDTRTTMTLRSSSGRAATVEASESTWYAPGIGRVRSSTTIVAGGLSEAAEQRLVGYVVGGARQGLVRYATLASGLVPVGSTDVPAVGFDGEGHLLVFPSYPTGASNEGRLEAEVLRSDGTVARRFDLADRRGWGLNPAVAYNGTNHLVVSSIVTSDPYYSTVFAQRVSPAGDLLNGATGVDVTGGLSGALAIASDGDGWLVACATYAEGLRVVRISAGGAVLGTLRLTPPWPIVPGGPGIAYGGSSYLIAWNEDRQFGGRILATRVRPDGTVLDATPIVVSTLPGAPETLVSVAFDGTRFLLVWGGLRSGETDVYAARVGTDGELIDGPAELGGFPVNQYPGQSKLPVAAFDGSRFVATWPIATWPWAEGIFAARIAGDGTVLDLPLTGPGLAVARPVPQPAGPASSVAVPTIAQAAGGETLFVWVDSPYSPTTKSIMGAWYAW